MISSPQCHLQRRGDHSGVFDRRGVPTDDRSGEADDDVCNKTNPAHYMNLVTTSNSEPQSEVTVEQVRDPRGVLATLDRGPVPPASDDAGHAFVAHQSVDRAGSGAVALPAQVAVHLAAT